MSRRNGRSVARRLIAEGKRYPPDQLEKTLRERLGPLGAGMDPQVQERLIAEAVAAAEKWRREHEIK
jgi:L-fucose isomerase-like protein